MLELYHFPGAVCAQKVRVALAEKQLDWQSHLVRTALRSPEYLRLNPGGYVPTLVHDGRVIVESRVINEYIEDAFLEPSLMPADPFDRARVALWTKQIDDSLHLNIFALTFATSFREATLALTPEARVRALPLTNPVKRQYIQDLTENGFMSVYFSAAVERFQLLLTDMDKALAETRWLVGDAYSLADVDFTPYLRRLDDLGFWPLVCERYPHVMRWFSEVRQRPSYKTAILDWISSEDDVRERGNALRATPHIAALLSAV